MRTSLSKSKQGYGPQGKKTEPTKQHVEKKEEIEENKQQEKDPGSVVSPTHLVAQVKAVLEIDKNTPDNWIYRSGELIRITGAHPFNAEPPLHKLINASMITPNSLHYVRNHGAVPKLDWKTHKLKVGGLVNKPREFSMDELRDLPYINIPVTLTCDGNRRKEVNRYRHTKGTNWGSGVISTAYWKGVKLCDVLNLCEVKSIPDGANYVCFEGCDTLPAGNYGTSIPLATALDPLNDILLAYEMNNELLPPDHGHPLRVIIPGFVGGRMVKWLKTITVTEKESTNWYHINDNKVFPPFVTFNKADREDWWSKPEFVIYECNINSVIATPSSNEIVQLDTPLLRDTFTVKGFAYTGGGRSVIRVEASTDDGKNWMPCSIEFPKFSMRNGIKRWTWCFWTLDLPIWKLLKASDILVRAWDASNNTQPKDLTWNLLGMMNNSWYRVKVKLLDESRIVFEHPTVPGEAEGGWLEKHPVPIKPIGIKSKPPYRLISPDEVKKHNHEDDPWIVVDGIVYSLSEFLPMHPGGIASIVINSGKDITTLFNSIHGEDAKQWMQHFSIGILSELGEGKAIPGISRPENWALQPRKWIDVKLVKRQAISPDSYLFSFELCEKGKKLGLPIGQHVLLEAAMNGDLIVRPYTPVSPITEEEDNGTIEFVIKIYRPTSFHRGGILTTYLEKVAIGTILRLKGPEGPIHYQGRGVLTIHYHPIRVRKISMVAGGTGITPVYQLIRAIADDPDDETEVSLLYANHSLEDILLKSELDEIAKNQTKVKIWYTISRLPQNIPWKYSVGRVDFNMIKEHVFPPAKQESVVLICGPSAMIARGVLPNLEKLGYHEETIFEF